MLSVNDGSVKFYCDNANINEYTRMNFFGTNTNVLLYKSNAPIFLAYNGTINISVAKHTTRITDMRNGNITYITEDGTIRNGDNASFTATISNTSTYGRIINIVGKMNCDLLIETF